MQAVQTAYVFTVRTSFTAETLCVCAVHNRQLFFFQDNITVDVGDRNFSCRDQIEIIYFAMIHLSFFVGKLSCAITGSGIDYCRRHDFCVSGFACFVQEEVDQGTLQLGTFSFVYREACTCNLYTKIEID